MKMIRLFLGLSLLFMAQRLLRVWRQPEPPAPPTIPGPETLGTCEGCGEKVTSDQLHTYMDHISKPAHASCVVFVPAEEMN